MSNFGNNRLEQEKKEKRDMTAKENLSKYFYDLSKAIFTAMVIGAILPLLGFTEGNILASVFSIILGSVFSFSFAYMANYIIKH